MHITTRHTRPEGLSHWGPSDCGSTWRRGVASRRGVAWREVAWGRGVALEVVRQGARDGARGGAGRQAVGREIDSRSEIGDLHVIHCVVCGEAQLQSSVRFRKAPGAIERLIRLVVKMPGMVSTPLFHLVRRRGASRPRVEVGRVGGVYASAGGVGAQLTHGAEPLLLVRLPPSSAVSGIPELAEELP